jgi:hypothetical protein
MTKKDAEVVGLKKNKSKSVEGQKSLTADELGLMGRSYFEGQIRVQAIQIIELQEQKAKTQLELLSAQYTLKNKELSELRSTLSEKRKEHQAKEAETEKISKEIKERLKLPDNWGFHPDTGEIILSKEKDK